jgi:DNA-binding MarR family transcriptional regulator
MDAFGRLAGELTSLMRAMKELHSQVVEQSDLPCELAGTFVLGRLAVLGPVRLTQLAQELGLDPSSVSRQVSSLERHGLVAKEKDPRDQRAQQLALTERGLAAVESLRNARAQALVRLLPDWSDADLDALNATLGRLNTDLEANRAYPGARQEKTA